MISPVWQFALVAVGLMLFRSGFILLRRGWWPQRVGDEAVCAACDYRLTGINSERCPECGAVLTDKAIAHGVRDRRSEIAWAGIGLMLLSLATFVPLVMVWIGAINWIEWEPASWLVSDLRSSSSFTSNRAFVELMRRDQAGKLSLESKRAIVDVAIVEQAKTVASSFTSELVEFAARQFQARHLTDAQKQKLLSQCVQMDLSVRPKVAAGDRVPYLIREQSRTSILWQVQIHYHTVKVDGVQVGSLEGSSGAFSGTGASGSTSSSVKTDTLGKHELQVTYSVDVIELNGASLMHEDRALTAPFEILPKRADKDVTLIDNPSMQSAMNGSITASNFKYSANGTKRISGNIHLTLAPMNLAFEVVARIDGREYSLGRITAAANTSGTYVVSSDVLDKPPPLFVDVILRSSEDAARATVDLSEIWKGELVLKDVPVTTQD
jgi:hypothetical protein